MSKGPNPGTTREAAGSPVARPAERTEPHDRCSAGRCGNPSATLRGDDRSPGRVVVGRREGR